MCCCLGTQFDMLLPWNTAQFDLLLPMYTAQLNLLFVSFHLTSTAVLSATHVVLLERQWKTALTTPLPPPIQAQCDLCSALCAGRCAHTLRPPSLATSPARPDTAWPLGPLVAGQCAVSVSVAVRSTVVK